MKKCLSLALTLILGISFLAPVSAFLNPTPVAAKTGDIVVSLRPSEQDLELTPGKTYEESVVVYNIGGADFDFSVEAAPYQTKDNSYEPDFFSENSYTKLANWITFEQTDFSVKADTSAEVKFTIAVPDDAPGGGQYAAILIRLGDADSESEGVGIISQLAATIHGHVKGNAVRRDGKMISHDFPTIFLSNPVTVTSVFENTGNIDYRVTESWTIRDFFTNREYVGPESANDTGYVYGTLSAAILPGTERTLKLSWQDTPAIGVFRVEQTISYFDQIETFSHIVVVCPIWLVALVGAFIVFGLIWLIAHIISRRHDKPQVF